MKNQFILLLLLLSVGYVSNAQCYKINSWQSTYIPNISAITCEATYQNRVWVKVVDTENMWASVALNDSHIAIYQNSNPVNYYFTGYLIIDPNYPQSNPPSLRNDYLLGDTGNQPPTYNKSPVQFNCPIPGRFGCIHDGRNLPRKKN